MSGVILLSTAYLPPSGYFALFINSDDIVIEGWETFHKQTYRNRTYLLSAHGVQLLTVPVFEGSRHNTPIKDIRIDYTKRWQQVHLGSLTASYRSSPFFEFYFEVIEKIIKKNHIFLLDLNSELLIAVCDILKIKEYPSLTGSFISPGEQEYDFRYTLSPKISTSYRTKEYMRVFETGNQIDPRISILDLIFNTGPDAINYL